MTRSHVLLHCRNARLVEAWRAAWEFDGKSPGGLKVLLSSPRWERRLLRFLELSEVGKIMKDGVGEEERTARLGGWIAWEAEEGSWRISNFSRSAAAHYPFTCTVFIKGDPYPEIRAQRNAEVGRFFLSGLARRGGSCLFRSAWVTVLMRSTYSLGVIDKTRAK